MPVVGLILHNVLSKYFHTKNNNLGDGKNQALFPSKFPGWSREPKREHRNDFLTRHKICLASA